MLWGPNLTAARHQFSVHRRLRSRLAGALVIGDDLAVAQHLDPVQAGGDLDPPADYGG